MASANPRRKLTRTGISHEASLDCVPLVVVAIGRMRKLLGLDSHLPLCERDKRQIDEWVPYGT